MPGAEARTRIGEVFAHELLRGDTGGPFESIEYAFREHGREVRGEDGEQPWNSAKPLSGTETRVEVCLAEARYVERRVPFVDLPGKVRQAKAAVDAGDESEWTLVVEGPVFRYVRTLREEGEERMIPPDLRLRTLYTVEFGCGPDRSLVLVEEGLRGRLEDVASRAVPNAREAGGVAAPPARLPTLRRHQPRSATTMRSYAIARLIWTHGPRSVESSPQQRPTASCLSDGPQVPGNAGIDVRRSGSSELGVHQAITNGCGSPAEHHIACSGIAFT